MEIDATLPPVPLNDIPHIAKAAEEIGFDGLWCSETIHDPFLPGALISEHTDKLRFGTAVAISFARSPTTMAYTAWDLAQASGGRFILGLGTQVKAHIVRRFGMQWPNSVVGKLREQIESIRAIWDTWQNGKSLKFRGEYYKLSLMSPFFNPGPIQHPDVPIYIAGVNKGLARLAGETADGFHVHPFHTPLYLKEVLIPTIEKGAAQMGRSRTQLSLATTVFVVTSSEEDFIVRSQIAFYASTPSYRPVMELHGWEGIAVRLSQLAGRGEWNEMAGLINDEILETFAVCGDPNDLPAGLTARYAGVVDRLGLYIPYLPGEKNEFWAGFLSGMRGN